MRRRAVKKYPKCEEMHVFRTSDLTVPRENRRPHPRVSQRSAAKLLPLPAGSLCPCPPAPSKISGIFSLSSKNFHTRPRVSYIIYYICHPPDGAARGHKKMRNPKAPHFLFSSLLHMFRPPPELLTFTSSLRYPFRGLIITSYLSDAWPESLTFTSFSPMPWPESLTFTSFSPIPCRRFFNLYSFSDTLPECLNLYRISLIPDRKSLSLQHVPPHSARKELLSCVRAIICAIFFARSYKNVTGAATLYLRALCVLRSL